MSDIEVYIEDDSLLELGYVLVDEESKDDSLLELGYVIKEKPDNYFYNPYDGFKIIKVMNYNFLLHKYPYPHLN